MLHKKKSIYHFVIVFLLMCSSNFSFAHCDTKDGPVVADARKAIEENNVNYVLKWVQPVDEKEIKDSIIRAPWWQMKLRPKLIGAKNYVRQSKKGSRGKQ